MVDEGKRMVREGIERKWQGAARCFLGSPLMIYETTDTIFSRRRPDGTCHSNVSPVR